jgi:ribulose-5-phosphate 4-epimerase/fuculose-1-phosphate aldolase
MMEANLAGLRSHCIVLWSKHGVMARSDQSVTKAADRIEYAETAAMYEYMDLVNGCKAEGLTEVDLPSLAARTHPRLTQACPYSCTACAPTRSTNCGVRVITRQ